MKYRLIIPGEDLKPYIRYFGVLEDDQSRAQSTTFKVVADGCPGLIFQENPQAFFDQNRNNLPQLFLHGMTTKHSEKTAQGNYFNIVVYFQPDALKTIFGLDAHELTNRYTNLDAVISNDLSAWLRYEKQVDRRIEILSNFIRKQIRLHQHGQRPQTHLLMKYLQKMNTNNLAQIQTTLNLSERSLERIFKSNVGVSPHLFLRISRFQAALNSIRQQRFPSLTAVAYHHVYADQSHYIKEFKEFAGTTPKQYLLHTCEQVENFPEWKL